MKSVPVAFVSLAVLVTSGATYAQSFTMPAAGLDLAGNWSWGRSQDADLGTAAGSLVDYGGIPMNEAARLYALAWDASRMTVRQQQCYGYVPPYFYVAPGNYRI